MKVLSAALVCLTSNFTHKTLNFTDNIIAPLLSAEQFGIGAFFMEGNILWFIFIITGKAEDYLRYKEKCNADC